jgi:hypothetical protein
MKKNTPSLLDKWRLHSRANVDPNCTALERRVLLVILDNMSDELGGCAYSIRWIAELLDTAPRHVRRVIQLLHERGYIEIVKGGGCRTIKGVTNLYQPRLGAASEGAKRYPQGEAVRGLKGTLSDGSEGTFSPPPEGAKRYPISPLINPLKEEEENLPSAAVVRLTPIQGGKQTSPTPSSPSFDTYRPSAELVLWAAPKGLSAADVEDQREKWRAWRLAHPPRRPVENFEADFQSWLLKEVDHRKKKASAVAAAQQPERQKRRGCPL